MIDLPRRPLPPTKALALECLARGPISGTWNGEWRSSCGDHAFNTHTVSWLVSAGMATWNGRARTEARITRDGAAILQSMEMAA